MSFLIGCDPEAFVRRKSDNMLVTAAGLIPGNKDEPFKVDGGAIQVDGMAVEFNTDPVGVSLDGRGNGSFETFDKNFVKVVAALSKAVGSEHSLVFDASVVFDKDYYDKNVPEDAKRLGCDPDFNAYTGKMNTPPSSDSPARGAAGHIHIGWGKDIPIDHPDHLEICREFVKCLDFWVGVGLTVIENDTLRRTMYGASGAFRPKSYGVEYRVPSNAWCRSKANRRWMWQLVSSALYDMKRGKSAYYQTMNKDSEKIRSIIDKSNKSAAIAQIGRFLNIPGNLSEG